MFDIGGTRGENSVHAAFSIHDKTVLTRRQFSSHRRHPWVDRGHVPLLFEVEGTPCVLPPPYFFGGSHFCTNAHGIHWMIGTNFVKF